MFLEVYSVSKIYLKCNPLIAVFIYILWTLSLKLVCVSKAVIAMSWNDKLVSRNQNFSLFNVPLAHGIVFLPFYLWVGKSYHEGQNLCRPKN